MKLLLVGVTFLLLVNCSVLNNLKMTDIVGVYSYSDRISYYTNIELKSDSTFIFRSEGGLSSSKSNGFWSVDGRKIVLNSFYQPHELGYEIIESDTINSDSLIIKVVDLFGKKLPFTPLKLIGNNGNTIKMLDFDSKQTFLKANYDSVYVSAFCWVDVKLSMSDLKFNTVVIKLDQSFQYYNYFFNEKWMYKKDRLYYPLLKKSRFQKQNYYKRVDSILSIIPI